MSPEATGLSRDEQAYEMVPAAFQHARSGDAAALAALIDRGVPVDVRNLDGAGPDARTPLRFAAMFDRAEVVALLLERGASASRRDAGGICARDLAQSMGATWALAELDARGVSAG